MSDLLDKRQTDAEKTEKAERLRLSEAGRAALARLQTDEDTGEIVHRLKERLSAYRKGRADLSMPAVPAADLYLLAHRYRGRGGKIGAVITEIDEILQDEMPGRVAPVRRRLA